MVGHKITFLLFCLLPLQFSLGSFGASDIPIIRLLIPVILLGWLAEGMRKKSIILPQPVTLFFLSSFLFWASLSFFWADNQNWALQKIIFWWNFFPLFFFLIALFQNERSKKYAFDGLIWGGVFVGLVGILQFIAQFFISLDRLAAFFLYILYFFLGSNFAAAVAEYPSIFVNINGVNFLRSFAFFPDPHIFAYYVAMLIPLAVYRAVSSESNIFERLAPGILFIATLLSFSRASYVALLVAFVISSGYVFSIFRRHTSFVVILGIFSLVALLAISPVATRLGSSFSAEDNSVTERSRLWQEAVVFIRSEPLLGVGLGNYPLQVKPSASEREPIYVHNMYLDITVEIGLIGLALFLLFILSCLPKIHAWSKRISLYQGSLFLSLIIFLTHSLFEYPLFSVHIVPLLLIILALLYVEKNKR